MPGHVIRSKIEVRPHAIRRLEERFGKILRLNRRYYRKKGKGFVQGETVELFIHIFKRGDDFLTFQYERKNGTRGRMIKEEILIKKCHIGDVFIFLIAVMADKRNKVVIRTVYSQEMIDRLVQIAQSRIDRGRGNITNIRSIAPYPR